MKRINLITLFSALAVVILFGIINLYNKPQDISNKVVKVGFIYDGDESTPYTNNFIRSQHALEKTFGENVKVLVQSNVPEELGEAALQILVDNGCDIIFTTSYGYGENAKKMAAKYPDIQFCQATCANANEEPFYDNYHTFMGEIYQGRYVAGIVAGMKLNELIENGTISRAEAKIGYVGAYPYAEVISGYTAFILGVRSIVPEATMTVKYINAWTNYELEKKCAEELIAEGCKIISQHSDTIGPAVACEATYPDHTVYHVGYNQSMIDIAPTTSLVSTRINWTPYIVAAVDAVLCDEKIEDHVEGHIHGNDAGAGFDNDWVQMLELNRLVTVAGTEEKVNEVITEIKDGNAPIFIGDYIGINPNDPNDTCDLRQGYTENENSSAPTFYYILKDVITVE